jgi:probable rRNA maturation factor
MELEIIWEDESLALPARAAWEQRLTAGVEKALLCGGGTADAEVALLLTSDARLRELNHSYRGIDEATDVLSFALTESEEPDCPESRRALGDIVISVPRAHRQAAEYGHSLERELVFLAVHGMLHLLGYDHQTETERAAMRLLEERVMHEVQ